MLNTTANTTTEDQLRRFDGAVRRIIKRTPLILKNRRLPAFFKDWKLTAEGDGLVVLFGVLDDNRIIEQTNIPLERYLEPGVLHDISTNACDGAYQVVRCNHTGAGYGIVLKAARVPRLPTQVSYPGHQRGKLAWGVTFDDRPVTTGWEQHMMIAGMSGFGKSTMLRGLVAQGLLEGFQLALCDVGARTFPMLKHHPALLTPLATDAEEALVFAQAVLTEIERRKALYEAAPDYPDKLAEYNAAAEKLGLESLSRLLVVFDEYTELMLATGGPKAEFSKLMTRLVVGARKWGITFVFAGQQFQREASGWIRDQCGIRVCFKVEEPTTASVVVRNADPTQFTHQGRALMSGAGRFQAYAFEKQLLIDLAERKSGLRLTSDQKRLAQQIGRDRLFSWENVARATGLGQSAARRLVEEWAQRGWAVKTGLPGGGRYLTDEVMRLVTYSTPKGGSLKAS